MPIIRSIKTKRLPEEQEEFFGEEMKPFVALYSEEEKESASKEKEESAVTREAPPAVSTKKKSGFWTRLNRMFHTQMM